MSNQLRGWENLGNTEQERLRARNSNHTLLRQGQQLKRKWVLELVGDWREKAGVGQVLTS